MNEETKDSEDYNNLLTRVVLQQSLSLSLSLYALIEARAQGRLF